MSGSDASLRETLDRLHRELEHTGELDAGVREELRALADEIQDRLTVSEAASPDESSLRERLANVARRFEESHPRIAEAVNRVMLGLAELGI